MNRACVCALSALALCGISFPAAALIFGVPSSGIEVSSNGLVSVAPPAAAKGPDGRSVRVIGLPSADAALRAAPLPAATAAPQQEPLSSAKLPPPGREARLDIRSGSETASARRQAVAHVHARLKPVARSQATASLKAPRKLILVGGLY